MSGNFITRALLLGLWCLQAGAEGNFSLDNTAIRQGEVLRVRGPADAVAARMNSRTVPLYKQVDGAAFGLMPVPVLTTPGAYRLEWLDAQGSVLHSQAVVVRNAHYPRQNIVLSRALANLKSTPEERSAVSAFLNGRSATRYWREPLEPPLAGCITSMFGVTRLHNGKLTGDYHAGVDQRGGAGTPIHAIAAGEVKIAQQFELRGGTVAIDHGQGLQSIYLHMSKVASRPAQRVAAGDVIGYVGSTGRSTGPHLHWTLYVQGEPVNPLQWVRLKPCASPVKAKKKT